MDALVLAKDMASFNSKRQFHEAAIYYEKCVYSADQGISFHYQGFLAYSALDDPRTESVQVVIENHRDFTPAVAGDLSREKARRLMRRRDFKKKICLQSESFRYIKSAIESYDSKSESDTTEKKEVEYKIKLLADKLSHARWLYLVTKSSFVDSYEVGLSALDRLEELYLETGEGLDEYRSAAFDMIRIATMSNNRKPIPRLVRIVEQHEQSIMKRLAARAIQMGGKPAVSIIDRFIA